MGHWASHWLGTVSACVDLSSCCCCRDLGHKSVWGFSSRWNDLSVFTVGPEGTLNCCPLFFSHSSSECMKMQSQRLYEVGGNIGKHHQPFPVPYSMTHCYCRRGGFFFPTHFLDKNQQVFRGFIVSHKSSFMIFLQYSQNWSEVKAWGPFQCDT